MSGCANDLIRCCLHSSHIGSHARDVMWYVMGWIIQGTGPRSSCMRTDSARCSQWKADCVCVCVCMSIYCHIPCNARLAGEDSFDKYESMELDGFARSYLFGRDRLLKKYPGFVPTDHPSCSNQHAVIQYRLHEWVPLHTHIFVCHESNSHKSCVWLYCESPCKHLAPRCTVQRHNHMLDLQNTCISLYFVVFEDA